MWFNSMWIQECLNEIFNNIIVYIYNRCPLLRNLKILFFKYWVFFKSLLWCCSNGNDPQKYVSTFGYKQVIETKICWSL